MIKTKLLLTLCVFLFASSLQAQQVNDGDVIIGAGPGGTDWVVFDGWEPWGESTSTSASLVSWQDAYDQAKALIDEKIFWRALDAVAANREWMLIHYIGDATYNPATGQYEAQWYYFMVARDENWVPPLPKNPLR